MNVFIFVGSLRGRVSYCQRLADAIKDRIVNERITIRTSNPREYNINYCIGCNECFLGNKCLIDDDMNEILQILLWADVFVIVTPVYVHAVPAPIKCLIDRLAFATHFMPFIGKASYIVSVSSESGNNYVNDYLLKVLDYLGFTTQKNISIQVKEHKEKVFNSYVDFFTEELIALSESFDIVASQRQEEMFKTYSSRYLSGGGMEPDAKRWILQGHNNHTTIQGVINERVRDSKFTYTI